MNIKQLMLKLQYVAIFLMPLAIYGQCFTGTSPALSTYNTQDATTRFGTGSISLAGSVMGFVFTRNAGLSNGDEINDDHFTGEYGINISHPSGSATSFATSIGGEITFAGAVGGLRFVINDIDNNDFVRVRVFDENGITIPLVQNSNFSIMTSPSSVEYNAANQEFYDDDNEGSSDNTRFGSVSFNFTGKKVSKIEFDYYDTNAAGTVTFADFKVPCIVANNDAYNIVKGVGGTTASVLVNDTYNGVAATTTNVTVAAVSTVPAGFTFNTNGTIIVVNTVVAGVYTISYQICQSGFTNNCNVATATILVLEDSDGDTIPNTTDLDDDNDGILDTIENNCTDIPTNRTFTGGTGISTATVAGWTLSNSTVYYAPTLIQFDQNKVIQTLTSSAVPATGYVWDAIHKINIKVKSLKANGATVGGANLEIRFGGVTYATLVSPNGSSPGTTTVTYSNGATGNTTAITQVLNANSGTISFTDLEIYIPAAVTLPGKAISFVFNSNAVGAANDDYDIDEVSIAALCDFDGDGIANNYDLDSDNDSCVDAIEGDENVTNAQLVTASGIVTVGTGSTASNQNLGNTINANGVPNVVNSGGASDIGGDQGQGIGSSANAAINACVCYQPAVNDLNTYPTQHGITALSRAGADNSNWPMIRQSAWTVLEAKTKGFVINRIATTALVNAIPNPVEGMMVFDLQADCLKINTDGTVAGWRCFNTQACP